MTSTILSIAARGMLAAALILAAAGAASAQLQVAGNRVLDGCGNVFVARGVEQFLGEQLPPGNNWVGLIDQIAATGANAVRVIPSTSTLGVSGIDAVLARIGGHGMVAYFTPNGPSDWLGRSDVRTMLAKHERYLILDAYGEPVYDDRTRFRNDAIARVQRVRGWGYRVPLTVLANRYGRDLPSLLQHGQAIVDADPLRNTILGWQAYWGRNGYYQGIYGMSLVQGVQAAANAPFPIQLGLDYVTDPPSQTADYGPAMSEAQARGVGWLWWDWFNPYGRDNNLTRDGTRANLTATGVTVVESHPASIRNTALKICSTQTPAPVRLINAGGGASGSFAADTGFSGGNVASRVVAIDRSAIPAPQPPTAVYQSERWGASTYRFGGYAPGSSRTIELHFAEWFWSGVNQRRFHVSINGVRVLTDYDILARAGARNKAVREVFTTTANASGEVVIAFQVGSVDQPKIDGLAIR